MDPNDPRLEVLRKARAHVEAEQARTVRNARIGAVLGAAALALVSLVSCLGSLGPLLKGWWWAAALALVLAVVTGLLAAGVGAMAVSLRRPEGLRTTGIAGRARFLEVGAGGVQITGQGGNVQVAQTVLRLEVHVPGKAAYPASVKDFVPIDMVSRLVPGTWLAVFVDPAKPARVLVDWEAGVVEPPG